MLKVTRESFETTTEARTSTNLSDRIEQLEKVVAQYRDEANIAQAEVDRLLEILKEMENEKSDKDKKIAELEIQMKEQSKKLANLKHKEQVEKKKNAQLLEEARRREDNLADDSHQLQHTGKTYVTVEGFFARNGFIMLRFSENFVIKFREDELG
ncbi:hypothetical protein scyTo_0003501 [Scyliorhinus torazame]|uniref:Uncharacterized protein n=1 Tax=Scyliorhinus torazame TaxID=75743 RepID=A0A401PMV3_SCYTO|nr:hypothetical protein [Scyliorhinus torazame]